MVSTFPVDYSYESLTSIRGGVKYIVSNIRCIIIVNTLPFKVYVMSVGPSMPNQHFPDPPCPVLICGRDQRCLFLGQLRQPYKPEVEGSTVVHGSAYDRQ